MDIGTSLVSVKDENNLSEQQVRVQEKSNHKTNLYTEAQAQFLRVFGGLHESYMNTRRYIIIIIRTSALCMTEIGGEL